MKNVLVCGGRDFADLAGITRDDPRWPQREAEYTFVLRTLDRILHPVEKITDDMSTWLPTGITIINGGARGVDDVSTDWAVVNWASLSIFEADWRDIARPGAVVRTNRAGPYDVTAGFHRNQRMIDEGKPDLCLAFPGGRGTADMVRRARAANVAVMEIAYELSKV